MQNDVELHRWQAERFRTAGDEETAAICDEYADLMEAHSASTRGAERNQTALALREFRQTWREIRNAHLGLLGEIEEDES